MIKSRLVKTIKGTFQRTSEVISKFCAIALYEEVLFKILSARFSEKQIDAKTLSEAVGKTSAGH